MPPVLYIAYTLYPQNRLCYRNLKGTTEFRDARLTVKILHNLKFISRKKEKKNISLGIKKKKDSWIH